jgi:tRNA dimethylallyltransferase
MPDPSHPPLVAIFGPTGAGKTSCAIDLALSYNGEVVNADSRYLYRRLNIGVAKPTRAERRGVPHHLLDIFDPAEFITIAQVQRLAYSAFNDIHHRRRLPILVGGTPMYMNAITQGWRIPEVPPDREFRAGMEARIAREGLESVAAELAEIDPMAAELSGRNPRRVIRALEIYHATGRPMSSLAGKEPPPYRMLQLALTRSRPDLYEILDGRVEAQLSAGLIAEVKSLLESGLTGQEPAFSAIGYRQLLPYLAGETTLADAVARIKTDTHRYVRHQMTWLRRVTDLEWFDTGETGWQGRLQSRVAAFVADIGTGNP